jgi:hypothetical protein
MKESWIGYLGEYGGPGAYGRKFPCRLAKDVYVRLQSPPMLLWLCEQVGATRAELRAAANASDVPGSLNVDFADAGRDLAGGAVRETREGSEF